MKRESRRQQHDFQRHHRHRSPWDCSEQSQLGAGEHVAALRTPGGQDGGARAPHVRCLRIVTDRFQRKIRFCACRQVERPVVKQRPAAMRALDGAQVVADPALQLYVDPIEEMLQQHVLGRDGRVGFQLEHPMAIGALALQQRPAGARNGLVQAAELGSRIGFGQHGTQNSFRPRARQRRRTARSGSRPRSWPEAP